MLTTYLDVNLYPPIRRLGGQDSHKYPKTPTVYHFCSSLNKIGIYPFKQLPFGWSPDSRKGFFTPCKMILEMRTQFFQYFRMTIQSLDVLTAKLDCVHSDISIGVKQNEESHPPVDKLALKLS